MARIRMYYTKRLIGKSHRTRRGRSWSKASTPVKRVNRRVWRSIIRRRRRSRRFK